MSGSMSDNEISLILMKLNGGMQPISTPRGPGSLGVLCEYYGSIENILHRFLSSCVQL